MNLARVWADHVHNIGLRGDINVYNVVSLPSIVCAMLSSLISGVAASRHPFRRPSRTLQADLESRSLNLLVLIFSHKPPFFQFKIDIGR